MYAKSAFNKPTMQIYSLKFRNYVYTVFTNVLLLVPKIRSGNVLNAFSKSNYSRNYSVINYRLKRQEMSQFRPNFPQSRKVIRAKQKTEKLLSPSIRSFSDTKTP